MGADLRATEAFDYLTSELNHPATSPHTGTAEHGTPWLVLLRVRGGDTSQMLELLVQSRLALRRGETSAVQNYVSLLAYGAEVGGVSRLHATLLAGDGQLRVRDRNSTNGTFVNGRRLLPSESHPLATGDELRLGKLALKVELVAEAATSE